MLENVLEAKNYSVKVKLTIQSLVSVGIIILAILLPQIVHLVAGQSGGIQWLPMYLPVLIGGCLLGWKWGLGIGIVSPLVSFLITSIGGNPMPAIARLPFMMVELAVFAGVSGLFTKKISQNGWMAFPAVILAQCSGRMCFLLLVAMFQSFTPFTVQMIWGQIQTGMTGMILQAILIPFIIMGLKKWLDKEKKND